MTTTATTPRTGRCSLDGEHTEQVDLCVYKDAHKTTYLQEFCTGHRPALWRPVEPGEKPFMAPARWTRLQSKRAAAKAADAAAGTQP